VVAFTKAIGLIGPIGDCACYGARLFIVLIAALGDAIIIAAEQAQGVVVKGNGFIGLGAVVACGKAFDGEQLIDRAVIVLRTLSQGIGIAVNQAPAVIAIVFGLSQCFGPFASKNGFAFANISLIFGLFLFFLILK
jgi:hypothetical protein